MKKKILLSLFVLMLTCIITFGVVGCDSASNPAILYCDPTTTAITVDEEEWEKAYGGSREPGMEVIQTLKEKAFEGVKFIYDADGDISTTEDQETFTYKEFTTKGGQLHGFNLKNKTGKITLSYKGIEGRTKDAEGKFQTVEITYTVGGEQSSGDGQQGGNNSGDGLEGAGTEVA